jgi:tetratricopeptide (TPR) repeat protein/predicted Ser/Thr protein kinase
MSAPEIFESVRIQDDVVACQQCRSTSRVARGLCLNCLLQEGLAPGTETIETLEAVLDEIDIRDADWRLGNYQILEEIGRGGMGVIYRALQRHSRRIVALKRVLSYHADSRETLARFRREAEAAASLDHPNILPIYEVGQSEDGLPFFSMKFAAGGSLVESRVALHNDPRRSVALMAKVARAVQHAHAKGILHRDLKPGNILLDGRGEPLVSDFGLAKWLDASSDLTRTLTIFGTPGYIAPEQARRVAANLTPAADVYSLGAILFDLFTGRPPFLGEHALAVIHQASEKPAPKLRSLISGFNCDLETICAKCLEREPEPRYQSAGDLAVDLEHWLEGRSIIARPVLPPVRVWRWSKRNPKLAMTACIVAILSAVALGTQFQRIKLSRVVEEGAIAQHSIAVLPVLDLDSGELDSGFAQQFGERLQDSIRRLGGGRVVSVTPAHAAALVASSDQPSIARIVRESNTRTVLTATKRMRDGKARISVHLIDGRSGELVFRRILDFDRNSSPALELHSLLTGPLYSTLDVADLSQLKLSNNDPGLRNERARELILAGKGLLDRRTAADINEAIERFEKATVVEPNSALAFSWLALARYASGFLDSDSRASAEEAATTAVRINPELGEALRAKAMVLYNKGSFREAIDALFSGFELADIHPKAASLVADILRTLGRPDKALAWYQIASQGGIRPGDSDWSIADCWTDLIDETQAAKAYSRASELFPYLPEGWMGPCRLALLKKDFATARNICSENWTRYPDFIFSKEMAAQVEFFSRNFTEAERLYRELAAKNPTGGGSFYGAVSYQSALGRLQLEAHDEKTQTRILQGALSSELVALHSAPHHPEILYRIAAIESSLGKIDRALVHLGQAFSEGWIDYRSLDLDPRFDALRATPVYNDIFSAMVARVTSLRTATAAAQAAKD